MEHAESESSGPAPTAVTKTTHTTEEAFAAPTDSNNNATTDRAAGSSEALTSTDDDSGSSPSSSSCTSAEDDATNHPTTNSATTNGTHREHHSNSKHHHHHPSFEPLTPQTEQLLLGGDTDFQNAAASPMMPRSDSIFSPMVGETEPVEGGDGSTTDGTFPVVADVEAHQPPVDKPLFSIPPRLGIYTDMIRELLDSLKKPASAAATAEDSSSSSLAQPSSPVSSAPSTSVPKSYFNVNTVQALLQHATTVLTAEQSLLELEVNEPDVLVVVGDVHGQFRDMLQHVLSQQYDRADGVPDRTFLFLGDYVDRGPQGVETMLLLFALKIEYPTRIYLLRGNHEESQTSRIYGFLFEVRSKFDNLSVWAWFNEVFCFLPLAALVTVGTHRFMAVHGGLSPSLSDIMSIKAIDRADYGGMLDNTSSDIVDGLLWSDPSDNVVRFSRNERGCGYLFGAAATSDFCEDNNLDFICRAHQLTMEGYAWTHDRHVLTVFSAPNYCGISGNKGALLVVKHDWELTFVQFQVSPQEEAAGAAAAPSFPQQRMPWGYFA